MKIKKILLFFLLLFILLFNISLYAGNKKNGNIDNKSDYFWKNKVIFIENLANKIVSQIEKEKMFDKNKKVNKAKLSAIQKMILANLNIDNSFQNLFNLKFRFLLFDCKINNNPPKVFAYNLILNRVFKKRKNLAFIRDKKTGKQFFVEYCKLTNVYPNGVWSYHHVFFPAWLLYKAKLENQKNLDNTKMNLNKMEMVTVYVYLKKIKNTNYVFAIPVLKFTLLKNFDDRLKIDDEKMLKDIVNVNGK